MALRFLGMMSLMMIFVSSCSAKNIFGIAGIILNLLFIILMSQIIVLFVPLGFMSVIIFFLSCSMFRIIEDIKIKIQKS